MPNRDEELEQLKKLSPYSLPDNPSQSGWSTKQVKAKFYQGLFYLYELLDGERETIEGVENTLANLDLEGFVTEEEAQTIKNEAFPHISDTPPDTNKTKIWFDTTNEEDYIDADTLNNVEEPILSNQVQQVYNENFEPLFFDNNNDNLSFDEPEEDVTFGEDDSNETLNFEN